MRTLLIMLSALCLAACATQEQKALGNVVFAGGLNGGIPVYTGTISRPFTVIQEVRIRRPQIPGPNYYDNGYGWVSHAGKELGADAIINYGDKRIPAENIFFGPGHFEAWGTAIKFK